MVVVAPNEIGEGVVRLASADATPQHRRFVLVLMAAALFIDRGAAACGPGCGFGRVSLF